MWAAFSASAFSHAQKSIFNQSLTRMTAPVGAELIPSTKNSLNLASRVDKRAAAVSRFVWVGKSLSVTAFRVCTRS